MAIYPTSDQIQTLLEGPQDQPVVMVNLLTYKPTADSPDEGVSGEEAYCRYAVPMRAIVESYGGRFIWAGRVDSFVIGKSDDRFATVALVEYPSRKVFVEVTQDPRVQEIGVHRQAGLESQWLIASTGLTF